MLTNREYCVQPFPRSAVLCRSYQRRNLRGILSSAAPVALAWLSELAAHKAGDLPLLTAVTIQEDEHIESLTEYLTVIWQTQQVLRGQKRAPELWDEPL